MPVDERQANQVLSIALPLSVETIGDCYVAATGLPEAQPLHAVIMVKFAHECVEKIHVVTQELANRLGEDTMELAMRIGINSGSTTAGVLR
jgi:class 3 adenylate cyclase